MATLTVLSQHTRLDDSEYEALERADRIPSVLAFERELRSMVLTTDRLRRLPGWRRHVYRLLPPPLGKAVEGWASGVRYNAVISWEEPVALFLAVLIRLTQRPVRHVALLDWWLTPLKAALLRLGRGGFDHIVTWNPYYARYLVDVIGLPSAKVMVVPYFVDTKFWRPLGRRIDRVCAVGNEARDYATLLQAMKGISDIRCDVATLLPVESSQPNVHVAWLSPTQLREVYARSMFLVMPSTRGRTTILQAMAMGKPVISMRPSRPLGPYDKPADGEDVIEEGVTGVFVPSGDPQALRSAILDLWGDPQRARRMGNNARAAVLERHRIEAFIGAVRSTVLPCSPRS